MGRSSGLRHGSSKLYTFSWPWHGGHILGSVHRLTRVRQEAWKGTVLTTKGRGSPPKDLFRGSGSGVGSIAGARLQRAGDAGLLGPVWPPKVRGQSLQFPELHQATPSPNLFWSSPCMFGEFLVARRKKTTSFFELRIWYPWIRSRRPDGQTPGLELFGAPERGAAAPRGLGQGERACYRWGVWVPPLYTLLLVLLLFFRKRQHRRKPKGDRAARKGFCSSRGLDVR